MNRLWTMIFAAAAALAGSAGVGAVEVEIVFSPKLESLRAQVNRVEQLREDRFRRHTSDLSNRKNRSLLANATFSGTRWAGAELIPEVADYTIENLTRAIVEANLRRERIDAPGERIRIELDRIGVDGYPLAALDRNTSFVEGTVSRIDAGTGRVIASAALIANLVFYTTLDTSYDGPELAFAETDANRRIGPALAYFAKRGLEKVFPDHKFRRPLAVLNPR